MLFKEPFMSRPHPLSQEALEQLFVGARTHHAWTDRPVEDVILRQLYDLMKWGPTSLNSCPVRLLFLKSKAAKEPLIPCLSAGNVSQVQAAPATVVVAHDLGFVETLPRLMPHMDTRPFFTGKQSLIDVTAFRSGTLQGAYMILAARSLGLDACPMSGFENAKVDEAFFAGTAWRSNFICNLGYGDDSKLYPRAPRLDFDEACRIR
jgi:3-hydroxypropanoate dehydrogenase